MRKVDFKWIIVREDRINSAKGIYLNFKSYLVSKLVQELKFKAYCKPVSNLIFLYVIIFFIHINQLAASIKIKQKCLAFSQSI